MTKDLNKVMIIGRLGTDPEMRYTPGGNPVTTFRVAAGRQWKDSQGEMHDETEWFNVVAWNKLAEICNNQLAKGVRVYLEGRLQTRSWEDQQSGQTRYKTEVVVNDMIILDTREQRASREPSGSATERSPQRDSFAPPLDIGDDDVPF